MRVAVTGVNGFVGRHLVTELVSNGIKVVGIGRETHARDSVDHYVCQDLTHGWPAVDVDAVIHLAGLSAVGPSFSSPQRYLHQNSAMLTHMCEALLARGSAARLLVVSSGAVYDADQALPLTENSRIGFSSPYVLSKVLVENQASYYAGQGLRTTVVRPFNHIGPGQGRGFIVPDLLAEGRLAAQERRPIRVGDLDTRRDYTDVRDVVRAYRLLATTGTHEHSVYNVCSGESWSGRELLALLSAAWGYGSLCTEVDPRRLRPGDPREIRGSSHRLEEAVDWRPVITIQESIRDFLRASEDDACCA